MNTVTTIALGLLAIAFALCLYRVLSGPRTLDRVVALDASGVCGMGIIVILAVKYSEPFFLDVALIVAALSFVGTVSIAKFLMRGKIIE